MSALQSLEPGEHRLTCPDCTRGPKDHTFGVSVDNTGAAVGHCFRCGYVETHRPERDNRYHPGKAVSRPVVPLKRETLSDYGRDLFATCTGLRDTIGERYLDARDCVIPPADGDLRFHPALKHPASDYTGPALVALVTHAATRAPLTLHRTWIRADGRKADCDPPRMLLGGHRKAGGVIRLWPDEAVTQGLGIAEGIESALSLAHGYQPVWACIDAGNLAAFPVIDVEFLMIAADNDEAGIKAAHRCAVRWTDAGQQAAILTPTTRGADFNDIAKAAA